MTAMNENPTDKCFTAIIRGEIDEARRLLESGVDPNATNREGDPLLVWAAKGHGVPACALLLEFGARVDLPGAHGTLPLQKAAELGKLEMCKLFLAHGAEINAANNNGVTALHCAAGAKRNGRDTCALLLSSGADPDAASSKGTLAVHFAASFGSVETCQLFADLGFDPSYMPADVTEDYLTPFQNAVRCGNVDNAKYYIEAFGEDVAQRTLKGKSLLRLVDVVYQDMRALLLSKKTENKVTAAIDEPLAVVTPPAARRSGMSPL